MSTNMLVSGGKKKGGKRNAGGVHGVHGIPGIPPPNRKGSPHPSKLHRGAGAASAVGARTLAPASRSAPSPSHPPSLGIFHGMPSERYVRHGMLSELAWTDPRLLHFGLEFVAIPPTGLLMHGRLLSGRAFQLVHHPRLGVMTHDAASVQKFEKTDGRAACGLLLPPELKLWLALAFLDAARPSARPSGRPSARPSGPRGEHGHGHGRDAFYLLANKLDAPGLALVGRDYVAWPTVDPGEMAGWPFKVVMVHAPCGGAQHGRAGQPTLGVMCSAADGARWVFWRNPCSAGLAGGGSRTQSRASSWTQQQQHVCTADAEAMATGMRVTAFNPPNDGSTRWLQFALCLLDGCPGRLLAMTLTPSRSRDRETAETAETEEGLEGLAARGLHEAEALLRNIVWFSSAHVPRALLRPRGFRRVDMGIQPWPPGRGRQPQAASRRASSPASPRPTSRRASSPASRRASSPASRSASRSRARQEQPTSNPTSRSTIRRKSQPTSTPQKSQPTAKSQPIANNSRPSTTKKSQRRGSATQPTRRRSPPRH